MNSLRLVAAIGILSGTITVLLGLYAPWQCGLAFVTCVLSAMVVCTAKGIA